MDILSKNLHQSVALKLDDQIYLDKSDVQKVISDNQELFNSLKLESINGSKMLYGYNKFNHPIKLSYEDDLIIRIVILTKDYGYKRFVGQISYDGHNYSGYQIQQGSSTIQGELSKVYNTVENSENIVQGCSRTDAGVHALNYYFHFDSELKLPQSKWLNIYKHQLPKDIQIKSLEVTHPLFHSRYDVVKKHYIYKIKLKEQDPFKLNYEWFVRDLDLELLNKNIKQLIGTHDFISFCKGTSDSSIRTIHDAFYTIDNDFLTLEFIGNGFLRYMIRIIVNTLVNISTKKLDLEISDIINQKSRANTISIAPASGLYLKEIYY